VNAPLIWIVLPGLAALGLALARRWERAVALIGTMLAAALALIAWVTPFGSPVTLGPWTFLPVLQIEPALSFLGRRFVLDEPIRPLTALVFLAASFWIGGAYAAGAGKLFTPAALGIAALLTAALAVQPFVYAALLVETAALLAAAVLTPPGSPVRAGTLRFLIFMTVGMAILLLAGNLLSGSETAPIDPEVAGRAAVLAGLGFAMLAAVFPFHTWAPMLGGEGHPYIAGFVFFFIPGIVLLFALAFLQRYPFLRASNEIFAGLRAAGLIMTVLGGMLAAFEVDLGRSLGYAAVMEIGLALLALSLGAGTASVFEFTRSELLTGTAPIGQRFIEIFFIQLLPRGLALGLWALAISILRGESYPSLRLDQLTGTAWRLPLAASGLFLAQFTLAGFPLLAGFPVRAALWSALASQSVPSALATLVGCAGLLVAGLRAVIVLAAAPPPNSQPERSIEADETGTAISLPSWRIGETRLQAFLLLSGIGLSLLIGLFPQWFLPPLATLAGAFAPRP
jgi:formate hydrogenlyase subunit 3/multisubunit Na+/H+ antiporter MnhD subunit